jgi:hypothetical protein
MGQGSAVLGLMLQGGCFLLVFLFRFAAISFSFLASLYGHASFCLPDLRLLRTGFLDSLR